MLRPLAYTYFQDTAAIESVISATKVPVVTTEVAAGTAQIPPTPSVDAATVGRIYTNLDYAGNKSHNPLLTDYISAPTDLISAPATMTINNPSHSVAVASSDIFQTPIATGAPPSQISQRSDHPVARLGVEQTAPISTNKFFQNFFLGSQSSSTFLHPYSIAWAKGAGVTSSYGMAVSHIDENQLALGPVNSYGAVSYFINPIGIQSFVLSADVLGSSTTLTTANITDMSAVVQLRASASASPAIEFPLTQGAGFVTAVYNGVTPVIQTGVFFLNMTKISTQPRAGVTKYRIPLNDGKTWYLYATSTDGSSLDLQVINSGLIRATSTFTGTIQIAKDPNGEGEALYDAACGSYATGVSVSGTAVGMVGSYTFEFQKAGLTGAPLLMFALPHHVQSFDDTTSAAVQEGLQLKTTTKGSGTAVVADSWTMIEPRLPVAMTFLPWTPEQGSKSTLSSSAKASILAAAQSELSQDISAQTDLNSMYYSGKVSSRPAAYLVQRPRLSYILTVSPSYDCRRLPSLPSSYLWSTICLERLLLRLLVWRNSRRPSPSLPTTPRSIRLYMNVRSPAPLHFELLTSLLFLVSSLHDAHDTDGSSQAAWGGVVSTATYSTGDSGADFGNTYYNDHHFHYGYHVLTAAVIGHLDSSWLAANRDWVNALVRDYANPSAEDPYFPVSRMFDWYHGHSFAHGLFETADGRDQESSSEDTMAAYAVKMWGMVSGDANMAARGDLMLAVQARSMSMYYLYTSNNTVEPADFIANKVAGILFENKIDHTTYFGTNIEYIQGIHMLPLLPQTTYIRSAEFVTEEWDQYFSSGRVDSVAGGWRGILYGNLATIDPETAYSFFNQSNFDTSLLDGGASLTWYLAFAAGKFGSFSSLRFITSSPSDLDRSC